LQRTHMHEFVHKYMNRPKFVDLMQRYCVLGDDNSKIPFVLMSSQFPLNFIKHYFSH